MENMLFTARPLKTHMEISPTDINLGYIVDVVKIEQKLTNYVNNKPSQDDVKYKVCFVERTAHRYEYSKTEYVDKKNAYSENGQIFFQDPKECQKFVDELNEKLYAKMDKSFSKRTMTEFKRTREFEQRLARSSWEKDLETLFAGEV